MADTRHKGVRKAHIEVLEGLVGLGHEEHRCIGVLHFGYEGIWGVQARVRVASCEALLGAAVNVLRSCKQRG